MTIFAAQSNAQTFDYQVGIPSLHRARLNAITSAGGGHWSVDIMINFLVR